MSEAPPAVAWPPDAPRLSPAELAERRAALLAAARAHSARFGRQLARLWSNEAGLLRLNFREVKEGHAALEGRDDDVADASASPKAEGRYCSMGLGDGGAVAVAAAVHFNTFLTTLFLYSAFFKEGEGEGANDDSSDRDWCFARSTA